MNQSRMRLCATFRYLLAAVLTVAVMPGDSLAYPLFSGSQQESSAQDQSARIPADQLDSLVAPIALYPDPLLAQVLAASTYPLEIIQLQQWQKKNSELKDQALADAVAKEPWDPSVQALAALPDLVKRLADDIQWTTDLGNAFLSQEGDVMDAVQRMRKKAQDKGNLISNEQQKVETKVIETKSVIVVEQANPQVVYVPSYNPTVVYGPPIYPYPPIYYPPPGYYAAGMAISFGIGVAMGAFWSGGWGWGCGWGRNNITINNYNNFNRNTNINGGNRTNIGGGNRASQLPARGGGDSAWRHNPQHRGGAPYRDRSTADRFGGTARGDSVSNRQANARQQVGRQGGNLRSNSAGGGGLGDRGGGNVGNRAGGGAGAGNRAGGGAAGGGVGAGSRAGGGAAGGGVGAGSRAGGANSIAGRDLQRSGGGNRDAFGGGSRGSTGYNGSSARDSSSRGSSSMGSRGGGGFSGGGGRGGGGGGGRRR
jgi:Protein of unknown function (DUF3300)